jgi:hypothetical protein
LGESRLNTDGGLRVVELLLLWEGRVRNARLRAMLGVHFTTASRLVAAYRELNPGASEYEAATKSYLAMPSIKAVLTDGTVDEYLALVDRTRLGTDPVVRVHMDLGCIDSALFSLLHCACEDGSGMHITHGSMRSPSRSGREIWPHSLVQAGRRWHVRAWCAQSASFRDFSLGRIRDARQLDAERPSEADPSRDTAWQTFVDFRLVAHPELSKEQQRLVQGEYFKGASTRGMTERGALLSYLVHDLRAALDITSELPPAYQLAVADPQTLVAWLLPVDQGG